MYGDITYGDILIFAGDVLYLRTPQSSINAESQRQIIQGTCSHNATVSFSASPTGPTFGAVDYNRSALPLNTWSCTVSNMALGDNQITVTCSL